MSGADGRNLRGLEIENKPSVAVRFALGGILFRGNPHALELKRLSPGGRSSEAESRCEEQAPCDCCHHEGRRCLTPQGRLGPLCCSTQRSCSLPSKFANAVVFEFRQLRLDGARSSARSLSSCISAAVRTAGGMGVAGRRGIQAKWVISAADSNIMPSARRLRLCGTFTMSRYVCQLQ